MYEKWEKSSQGRWDASLANSGHGAPGPWALPFPRPATGQHAFSLSCQLQTNLIHKLLGLYNIKFKEYLNDDKCNQSAWSVLLLTQNRLDNIF